MNGRSGQGLGPDLAEFCYNKFLFAFKCIVFFLDDQSHVLFVGKARLLALPEAGVNGKGVDRHRQMFRVHLRETLSTRIVPINHTRLNSIKFINK